jgi:hypothetical protein
LNRHAPWVLESIAGLFVDVGRTAMAVELVGTAGRLREELDAPMPYWDQRRCEPDIDRARAALGEESFAAAAATGRARDLETTSAMIAVELAEMRTSTAETHQVVARRPR